MEEIKCLVLNSPLEKVLLLPTKLTPWSVLCILMWAIEPDASL